MMCHSSNVPITPMSIGQCRSIRCRTPESRRPAQRRSRTDSAAIEAMTQMIPTVITMSLSPVGLVMKRVSISIRAERPCWTGTFSSVNTPVTCGFLSGASEPVAPGMPTKSAPTAPALAHARTVVHEPAATAARDATAATLSRKATVTESAVARTNRPLRDASIPSGGLVAKTNPPAAGRVAIAEQGIETSSASGAPETSGAVMFPTGAPGPALWGHRMVAVVCRTGSSGVNAHSATPVTPARTAISLAIRTERVPCRAIRPDSTLSRGTSVDGRRRAH